MKTIFASLFSTLSQMAVVCLVLVLAVIGCQDKQKQDGITRTFAYDSVGAKNHIEPQKLLLEWAAVFRKKRESADTGNVTFKASQLADAETFDKDAIIALLTAPGIDSVRAYHAIKPNGEVAICLLPIDSKGNIIPAILVYPDDRTGAINIPGISSAYGRPTNEPQGVEDSQRRPPY